MYKYEYSNELATLVKQFLIEDDWHFSFDENTGVFDFGLRIKGKIQNINYMIIVHKKDIVVYGICPIGVDDSDANIMAEMAKFICRTNDKIKNGCFQLDFSDGEIRFKSFIDCDESIPSNKVIENSIYCTAAMFKQYSSDIVDIILSRCTAEEVAAKDKKSSKDNLCSVNMEETDETIQNTDIEGMLARLATRFGIIENNES